MSTSIKFEIHLNIMKIITPFSAVQNTLHKKMKFSVKEFFSKSEQIDNFLRICELAHNIYAEVKPETLPHLRCRF